VRRKGTQLSHRSGGQDDLEPHSGQILARLLLPCKVGRTLRISCQALPPPNWPAGAQGGTSACRTGAALSFVSCIRLFDRVIRSPNRRYDTLSYQELPRAQDEASRDA
jgi:hypothetical protein